MILFKTLKIKKIFFLQIFFTIYVSVNLIGGERGLVSYFEKKEHEKELLLKSKQLSETLKSIENKNLLLSEKIDLDYIDTLYREKFKFGKENEILIKLK